MILFEVNFNDHDHSGLYKYLVNSEGYDYICKHAGLVFLEKEVKSEAKWYQLETRYRKLRLRFLKRIDKHGEEVQGGTRQQTKALNLKLDREKFEREVIEPIKKARLEFSDEVGELPEYQTPAERRREVLENPPGIVNHTPFTLPDESP